MEKALIIERVKLLSGETDDAIVDTYLDIAKDKILAKAYPFKDTSSLDVPSKYHSILVDATVYLLNKRGAEGELSHNENGISRTYGSDDLPIEMMKRITPYCSV